VPYIYLSGVANNIFYPNMKHLTCVAYGFYQFEEMIKTYVFTLEKLIAEIFECSQSSYKDERNESD